MPWHSLNRLPKRICKRNLVTAVMMLLVQPVARGDVTFTLGPGTQGHNSGRSYSHQIMIKGQKMRIEFEYDKKSYVTIYDLESGQEISLDTKRKIANVFDLSVETGKLEKSMKRVRTSVQPTGTTRQVLGMNCDDYNYEVAIELPRQLFNGTLVGGLQRNTGTLCVAFDAIGSKDFAAFAQSAKSHGYLLGSISEEQSSPVNVSTALFSAIGTLNGIVLDKTEKTDLQGGPGVGFYGTPSSYEIHSEVTAITGDPISDDQFRIPAGWKIHKDRGLGVLSPIKSGTNRQSGLNSRGLGELRN